MDWFDELVCQYTLCTVEITSTALSWEGLEALTFQSSSQNMQHHIMMIYCWAGGRGVLYYAHVWMEIN